jgi:hypothetical protein
MTLQNPDEYSELTLGFLFVYGPLAEGWAWA